MVKKQRQQSPQALREIAKETIAALDGVEESLWRFGLRNNAGVVAGDPAQVGSSQEYLASIKRAKEEAVELRHEKEYRQFMSEEQKRMNMMMLTGVNKEKVLRDVIQKALCLLDSETRAAREAESKRVRKSTEQSLRATELQRKKILHDRVCQSMNDTSGGTPAGRSSVPVGNEDSRAAKRLLKANSAREYCHTIATGVVEVAMRVADGMYIFNKETGTAVRRVPQDLSVTQWRAWVEEFVFPKTRSRWMSDTLAVTPLRELRDPNYKSLKFYRDEDFSSSGGGDNVTMVEAVKVACDADGAAAAAAATITGGGTSTSAGHGMGGSGSGGGAAAAAAGAGAEAERIIKRVTALQCKYEDNLISRALADAKQLIKIQEESRLRVLLDDVRRQNETQCTEEAVPGWTHRLPPPGCFVFGDDLSGLKILADAALGDAMHEAPLTQLKQRSSAAMMAETVKCSAEFEAIKSDNGSYRILLPSMLTRIPQTAAGQGSGGGYSAASAKVHKGGGGASAFGSSRVKEGKQVDDVTESKQYIDTLCDLLVKELLAVHQSNLQLVMRSGADSSDANNAAARTLRTLFLVGFPETELFWRTLHQKLHIAVDAMEQEMDRALKSEEVGEDVQPPPTSRGRSTSQRAAGQPSGGTALRRSGSRPTTSSGKRALIRSPVTGNEDDCVSTKNRVYPPLCLLGIFLQYDIPSRYRRLRAATSRSSALSQEQKHHKTASATSDEDAGDSCNEWSMQKLRKELIKQEFKMRVTWKRWRANVSKSSVPPEPEAEKCVPVEKQRRRARNSVSRKTSDPAPIAVVASQAPPLLHFPKVLFFFHKEDITSHSEVDNHVEFLINTMKFVLNPGIRSATRNDSLVPGQLAAPLRLGDYRLPPNVLFQLMELHQRFYANWNESGNPSAAATLVPSKGEDNETLGQEEMEHKVALVETEVHRVFQTFASDVLHFIANDVLPSSLWTRNQSFSQNTDVNANGTLGGLGRTMHFFSLDTNYDESREALYTLFVNGMSKLTATSALLLCCVLDVALVAVGEALGRLCAWVCCHIVSSIGLCMDGDKGEPLTSSAAACHTSCGACTGTDSGSATGEDESCFGRDKAIHSKTTKARFLAMVPRLSFDEVSAMVEQLDGQDESFDEFRRTLWSYASRVHQTALDCFCAFLRSINREPNMESYKGWEVIAPYVTQVILACLFAFSPAEAQVPEPCEGAKMKEEAKGDETVVETAAAVVGEGEKRGSEVELLAADGVRRSSGSKMCLNLVSLCQSPSVSVTLGRVVAAIRVLRRCCTVMGLCAARWVDSMYATALAVPLHGSFPPESRPADISAIFSPPDLVVREGGVSSPTLALQLLSTLAPTLNFVPKEERYCWWETEMEVVLQNFSMYQKPLLDKEEFVHCVFQAQLGNLWRFLPVKVHIIAERIGVSLPFPPSVPRCCRQEGEQHQQQRKAAETLVKEGRSDVCITLPWLPKRQQQYCEEMKLPSAAADGEEEAIRMFRSATRGQQQGLLGNASTSGLNMVAASSHLSIEVMETRKGKRPMLHLREYFISAILHRLWLDDPTDAIDCSDHADAVHEPSTMELREMVKSLPRAVREQGPAEMLSGERVSMEEWSRIKWWRFFDFPSQEKSAAFIQRYLLRILTVCFRFTNGEICTRLVPFLPDVLSFVARTNGPQAMLGRYCHALAALNASRDKKLFHCQQANVAEGPLMVFDLSLTVAEALFFFQRAGGAFLRGPCNEVPCHELPNHHTHHQHQHQHQQWQGNCVSISGDGRNAEDDCDDDALLTLEMELTLLLEVENRTALSLPLLGSSHWGQHIIPRLVAIPPETNVATSVVR